jgi:PAS domain S-box-containing protein
MPTPDDAVEQERARLRALIDAMPDLVWMKDPEGRYISCNVRFEQLFGHTEAEIRGHTDFDFVSDELARFFRHHDQLAMQRDGPSVNEERLTFADGHQELTHTIKTPVRDRQGRLLGVLGIGRDITALREVEDEYRWLFERNPAPMLLYERQSLRLRRVNEAFCALYGLTPEQAQALLLTDLHLPEDRDAVRMRVERMHGLVNVGEWRHVRSDGRVLNVVAQSHDIHHEGTDCRIVVVTDVSPLARSRQRDRLRLALMDRLARGDALESLLEQLVTDHEAMFPSSLCSVLLVDAGTGTLRHGAAPSLDPAYVSAVDGIHYGPGVGSCGTAAHTGRRAVAEDMLTHPDWASYRHLAIAAGLRSCWSEPVISPDGRVLATFAVYHREPGTLATEEVDQLRFAVQLAATLIGHAETARALRDSERRQRDILQALPVMVWVKDTQGVYTMCNASFAHMAGRPVEQIVGRRDEDITSDESAARYAAQDQQVLQTCQVVSGERWMNNQTTGERVLLEVIKTPLFDHEGRPVAVMGVARDITLIKQGASAVAEQDRLIDTMFGQTTDAIALIDPQTLRFVTFNDAACRGLGYTREQFAQLTPRDLRRDHDLQRVHEANEHAMAGQLLQLDVQHVRADGSLQDAALTLRRVSVRGRDLVSAVWRDVTDERRRELRIQRLNRSYAVLSAANEAVVRLRDRDALFAEVCRIAVQVGGFRLAWVGSHDAVAAVVRPTAWAGQADAYLQPAGAAGGAGPARAGARCAGQRAGRRWCPTSPPSLRWRTGTRRCWPWACVRWRCFPSSCRADAGIAWWCIPAPTTTSTTTRWRC